MKSFALIGAFLFIAWITPVYADEVPQLRQRVTDLTQTLSQDQVVSLDANLEAFERATSNQIVVLMIATLNGGALEDYSYRVADANKIGKKDRNNGVFVLIVKDDHKIRIDVGYGLEGVLTDALSSQIIRRIMIPRFKDGNYSDGIGAGIDAIEKVTKGEFKGDDEDTGQRRSNRFVPLFFIFFFFAIIRSVFSKARGHYIGGGKYGRGPWFGGPFGGFGGGGFGGGGFGGGGFGGGGGFRGGGGSFGGGGASGSW